MSHDTHGHHHEPQNEKPIIAFRAGFYFVLILAGLFIAAMAFVKSMSHEEGGHDAHHEATHEQHHDAAAGHEAAGHESHATEAAQHETATPAAHTEEHAEEAHH